MLPPPDVGGRKKAWNLLSKFSSKSFCSRIFFTYASLCSPGRGQECFCVFIPFSSSTFFPFLLFQCCVPTISRRMWTLTFHNKILIYFLCCWRRREKLILSCKRRSRIIQSPLCAGNKWKVRACVWLFSTSLKCYSITTPGVIDTCSSAGCTLSWRSLSANSALLQVSRWSEKVVDIICWPCAKKVELRASKKRVTESWVESWFWVWPSLTMKLSE